MIEPERLEDALPSLVKQSGWVRPRRPASAPVSQPQFWQRSWMWTPALVAAGLALFIVPRLPQSPMVDEPADEWSEVQSLPGETATFKLPASADVTMRYPGTAEIALVPGRPFRLPMTGEDREQTVLLGRVEPGEGRRVVLRADTLIHADQRYAIEAASELLPIEGNRLHLRPGQSLTWHFGPR